MGRAYNTIIISCHEEISNKMVYTSKREGVIRIDGTSPTHMLHEQTDFTIESLKRVIEDYNKKGYQVMSLTNQTGRGSRGDIAGLTLSSTIVMSREVSP